MNGISKGRRYFDSFRSSITLRFVTRFTVNVLSSCEYYINDRPIFRFVQGVSVTSHEAFSTIRALRFNCSKMIGIGVLNPFVLYIFSCHLITWIQY